VDELDHRGQVEALLAVQPSAPQVSSSSTGRRRLPPAAMM
jgi:hypothetical protein